MKMENRRNGNLSTIRLVAFPTGRINRLQFWYGFVLATLLFSIAMFVASIQTVGSFSPYMRPVIVGSATLGWILVIGNMLAKRIRDLGIPGLPAWIAALLFAASTSTLFFHDHIGVSGILAGTATKATATVFFLMCIYGLFRPGEDCDNQWGPTLYPKQKSIDEIQTEYDITPDTPRPANDERRHHGSIRAEYDTTGISVASSTGNTEGAASLSVVDPKKIIKNRRLR